MNKKIWSFLVIIRILIGICQNGYIHPDEFFQTIEISAGDILEIDVLRTWEFTSDNPIRSIIPVFLFWAPPFLIYRIAMSIFDHETIHIFNVLTFSRIYTSLMSLIIDYNLVKLCEVFSLDQYKALTLLSVSYVTLVYYTRSFSNTAESFLFVILIACIAKDIFESNVTKSDVATRIRDIQEPLGDEPILVKKYMPKLALISFFLILGIFNRPTFILFAFIPMFYLIFYRVFANFTINIKLILNNISFLLVYSSIFSVIFVLLDTIYFRAISFYHLGDFKTTHNILNLFSQIVVTPFNFFAYNSNQENLKEHGIHARYMHLFVNMPLLFGPLVYFILKQIKDWKNNKNYQSFLLLSIFVPLLMLSLPPHQEPRFLIPLLTPIILLSVNIFGSRLFTLYLVLNVLLCLFYGVFHQGGILPALSNLQHLVNKSNSSNNVIFWKTYMPPRFVLMQRHDDEIITKINVSDLAGTQYSNLFEKLVDGRNKIGQSGSQITHTNLLLVLPGSLAQFVKCNLTLERFNVQEIGRFYFHLTTENFPRFVTTYSCSDKVNLHFLQSAFEFMNQISLIVYRLNYNASIINL